jgi:hypothetical protein
VKYADFKPINPSDLDMAFGAASSFRTYAPMYVRSHVCEIEEEDCEKKWLDIMARWFYRGLPKGTEFIPRPGIDKNAAIRHIKTVLGSFEPDHGSKEIIVAFLLGLWFKDIQIPSADPSIDDPERK